MRQCGGRINGDKELDEEINGKTQVVIGVSDRLRANIELKISVLREFLGRQVKGNVKALIRKLRKWKQHGECVITFFLMMILRVPELSFPGCDCG